MKTACCDYQCKDDDYGPVFTNTGNNVVQCHNCGEVYVKISDLAALREQMAAARVAVEKWVPIHANDCAGWCIDEHAASMALEGCDCGIADEDIACRSARRAVGLEEGK